MKHLWCVLVLSKEHQPKVYGPFGHAKKAQAAVAVLQDDYPASEVVLTGMHDDLNN